MSIYSKLAEARIKVQESGMKETGNNKFAGYTYFELSSILPVCNRVCKEMKLLPVFSIIGDEAMLTIHDGESEGSVTFTLPNSEASLKGCHAVQNMGAVQTYLKRYLYQNAFEIAECDALDSTMNPNEQQERKWTAPTKPAKQNAQANAKPSAKAHFYSELKRFATENPEATDLLKERVKKAGFEDATHIPEEQFEKVLSWWPECVQIAKLGANKVEA